MVQLHNGTAGLTGAPIELGDFLPERREVKLNGQKYMAWVTTNQRYPRRIMAQLDRAARNYNKAIAPLLVDRSLPNINQVVTEIRDYVAKNEKSKVTDPKFLDLLENLEMSLQQSIEYFTDDARREAVERQPEAWAEYLAECVQLLIPNLLESEIELIDTATLERLLQELGYLATPETHVEKGNGAASDGDPLIGLSSQGDSGKLTQEQTQTSS